VLDAAVVRSGALAERLETGLVRWSIAGTVLLALALLTILTLLL